MKTFDERYKEILLETFAFTIDFLNEHHLRWFVGGGTMIGTIRHKGMIPWDDDVDISMPREDFEKFLKLRPALNDTDYEIRYLDDDMSYYMPFAKLCYKNSSLWEFKHFPCVFGVYIDVFPMDIVDGTKIDIQHTMSEYNSFLGRISKSRLNYSIEDICKLFVHGRVRKVASIIRDQYICTISPEKASMVYRNYEIKLSVAEGNFYVCYGGAYGLKEIYRKEWFEQTLEMPFEHLKVNVPCGYDALLTQNYGDYMTPPPPEKCIASHDDRYYVNLNEGLTIDQVKIRIKEGERKVY